MQSSKRRLDRLKPGELDGVSGGIRQGQLGNCYLCSTINGIERTSPGYLESRFTAGGPDIVATQFEDGRVVFMEQPRLSSGVSPIGSTGTPAELATERAWALARGNSGDVVIDPALRATPDPFMRMYESITGRVDPAARAAYGTDAGGSPSEPMRQLGLSGLDHRLPALDSTAIGATQRPSTVSVLSSVPTPPGDTLPKHAYTVGDMHEGRVEVLNPHGERHLSLAPTEVGPRFSSLDIAEVRGLSSGPQITTEHLQSLARNLPFDHPGSQVIRAAIEPTPLDGVTIERGPTAETTGSRAGRIAGGLFAGVPIASNALLSANEAYRGEGGPDAGFLNPTVERGLQTINNGAHGLAPFFPVGSMLGAPVRDAVANAFGDTFRDPSLSPAARAAGAFVQNGLADTAGLIASLPGATVDLALLPFTAPVHAARLLGTPEPLTAATQNLAFRRDMDLAASTYRDLAQTLPPASPDQQRAYQEAALAYARDPFVQQELYDAERFLGARRGTGTMDDVALTNQLLDHYQRGTNDSAAAEIDAAAYETARDQQQADTAAADARLMADLTAAAERSAASDDPTGAQAELEAASYQTAAIESAPEEAPV